MVSCLISSDGDRDNLVAGAKAKVGRNSALTLFVPGVFTNDPQHAFAANHAAVVAHALDRGADFHG